MSAGGSAARNVDVVVVGAGIAGLTAAYDLEREGARVVVCEQGPRAGGLIHTETHDRFLLEGGPDAMLVQKPAALGLCHELGLIDEIVTTLEPRTAYVVRDGALHPVPARCVLGLPVTPQAVEQCGMLAPDTRRNLARTLHAPREGPTSSEDESIRAFVERHWCKEVAQILAQPILGGIHAGDVERLSLRALFPALADAEAQGSSVPLKLASRQAEDSKARGPEIDGAFRSLRGGMARLVERLASELSPGVLSLNTSVEKIQAGRGFSVETSQGPLRARAVVLAIPAWAIGPIAGELDADLADACARIPYASSATINLAYEKQTVGAPLAGTGFVVPRGEPSTRLLAASWTSSKWPDRAPEGTVLLRAFAGGILDDDVLEVDDEALAARAHQELSTILRIASPPLFTRVHRWPRASAQYEVGHAAIVANAERAAARHPGLWLTGSAFRGVGLPDTIADARSVVVQMSAPRTSSIPADRQ